jgi:DNA-binding transcriptional LysR family regulator
LLPQLVRRLSRNVGALSVTSGTTHPLLPELRAGELDLLLTSEQVDDDDIFCCEPLLAEPIVMVLPKDRPRPRDWDDIALLARELEFISYGSRRRLARIVNHQFARFGIEPRGHLEFDSSIALFDIVSSGAGWAATTPMCMLCAGMSEADLQIVPFPDVTPIRSINAIWMREREDTSIHMVTEICRTIFTELAPKLVRLSGGMGERVQVLSE